MSLGPTDASNQGNLVFMVFPTTLEVTSGNLRYLCWSTIPMSLGTTDAGNQSNLVTVWRLRPLSR